MDDGQTGSGSGKVNTEKGFHRTMKRWQFFLGVIISLFFLWLALRGLHLEAFWQALQTAKYGWLIPGIGLYFLAVVLRAWRWHYLLAPLKEIPAANCSPSPPSDTWGTISTRHAPVRYCER
jgi:hypothetical protein